MFANRILILLSMLGLSLCYADSHKVTDVICSGNTSLFVDGKEPINNNLDAKNIIVEDGVMIISGGNWHINIPKKINSLSLHDNCQFKAKHWDGHISNFIHNSKNDAIMDGFFNIDKLLKTGSGRLFIYWLNDNDDFVATVEAGKVYIAGQVKRLILQTTGNSHFDGQHLISRRVLLKAADQSTAQVHPVHALTVFSINQSHVGYVRPVSYSNLSSIDESSIVMEPFRQD
ncbi:MAG: hypothetical protein VX835_05170 [Pseudomonadota bacterium]|nr:hypothetical protein [Pseudomonadota bacterium]